MCYQNALNFTLEMCEKHKPETRVSERHKPGFRVWENERVSPGPGFSKTQVFQKPGFQSLVVTVRNPYSRDKLSEMPVYFHMRLSTKTQHH